MTSIKDIQKVYKKVRKNIDTINNSFENVNPSSDLKDVLMFAENIRKAGRTLNRIAFAMSIDLDKLEDISENENNFALYCLMNNGDMNNSTDSEDDSEDDSEGE